MIDRTGRKRVQRFVDAYAAPGPTVYTDGVPTNKGMDRPHAAVRDSVGEYAGHAHTNGIESSWSMINRVHRGGHHRLSAKHLQRYFDDLAGRQNIWNVDTLSQVQHVVAGIVGRRPTYRHLVAEGNGRSSVAT